MSNKSGFTLVEIALVLTLIGLAIGGVTLGASMYDSSRLNATYARVEAIQGGMNNFIRVYKSLPGDFPAAEQNLANCAPPDCFSGNGDTAVGATNRDVAAPLTLAGEDLENINFFVHLERADMIPSMMRPNPTISAAAEFGDLMPRIPTQGGFRVISQGGFTPSYPAGDARLNGIFLVWQAEPFAAPTESFPVSPKSAAFIDRKFDDGLPLGGDIMARGTGSSSIADLGSPDGCRTGAEAYDELNEAENCYMLFRIRDEVAGPIPTIMIASASPPASPPPASPPPASPPPASPPPASPPPASPPTPPPLVPVAAPLPAAEPTPTSTPVTSPEPPPPLVPALLCAWTHHDTIDISGFDPVSQQFVTIGGSIVTIVSSETTCESSTVDSFRLGSYSSIWSGSWFPGANFSMSISVEICECN